MRDVARLKFLILFSCTLSFNTNLLRRGVNMLRRGKVVIYRVSRMSLMTTSIEVEDTF